MKLNIIRTLEARATMLLTDESGMSTVEYAIGTVVIYPCTTKLFMSVRDLFARHAEQLSDQCE